jgi:hypothetical protein
MSAVLLAVTWFASSGLAFWFGAFLVTMAIAFNRRANEQADQAFAIVVAYHRFWNSRH